MNGLLSAAFYNYVTLGHLPLLFTVRYLCHFLEVAKRDKMGVRGFPPGKFFKTTPFLSLETPFLYKLHNSNDVEMTLFRC